MKAKEFIFEEAEENIISDYELTPEDVILGKMLKTHCMEYINQIGIYNIFNHEKSLYRGVQHHEKYLIAKQVRLENRTPLDSSPELHQKLNDYFVSRFGEPFRDAVFASGNEILAGEYTNNKGDGGVYVVFPSNGYRFIWSDTIKDLWSYYKRFKTDDDDKDNALIDFIDDNNLYTSSNLKSAIASHHEIMIRCDQYIGYNVGMIPNKIRQDGIIRIIQTHEG